MKTLTSQQISQAPDCLSRTLSFSDGETFEFRVLQPNDGSLVGRYFESLSAETRTKFGPHPLTMDAGHTLCSELNYDRELRLIAIHRGEAIAYFILILGVRENSVNRYREFGIDLSTDTDCTFAPSVADTYQNKGLGSILLPEVLEIASALNFSRMILSGGTRDTNHRAIHFYEKFGFRKVGSFETTVLNHDMILEL